MFSYDYFNMQQCLLLILCFMLFDQFLTQLLPIIKQTVMFGNVSLIREIRFSENTTLLDDIKLLDSIYEEQINKKEEENNKLLIKQKNKKIIKRQPKIRILLVGDHSLFEKFFGLYGEDEYSAYNGLTIYLNGIFNQLKSVFNNQLPFLTQFSIQLEMVGVPMIILRPEDCPFRGNLINLNKTLFNSSFLLNNSSSLIENNFIWNSIDSLLAVQWASQWVREYEPTGSLPLHEHVMIITGLVSGNVF